jgi:hypothetical protein
MPSKSEIKKNPKSSKIGISKSIKTTTAKKSTLTTPLAKSKAITKKVAKTISKESATASRKKPVVKRVTKSAQDKISVSISAAPTIEQITARAHQIWLDEGCPEGRADIHWQLAESELTQI